MSQLAAERPTRGSSKPSLGGLIKSSLIYALLSAIPPAKRAVTVARPPGAAGARATEHRPDRLTLSRTAERPRTVEGDMPARRGRFHGPVGKTFCGALMPASAMIGCLQSLRAWCSTAYLHYFPQLPRWCRCTVCSRRHRQSVSIFPSSAAFFRPAGWKLFRSRSIGSQQRVTRSSALPSRQAWDLLFGVPTPE